MQTFCYRHNSGFQPFSMRFLARIKFQMPLAHQRSRIRIIYWRHIQKQPFTREGDRELSSYNIFLRILLPGGGGGGGIGHVPSKFETWLKLTNCSPLILFQKNCMAKTKKENNKLKHKQRLIPNVGSLWSCKILIMFRNGHKCTKHLLNNAPRFIRWSKL